MYAFHLEVPPGASALEADFEVLTSPRPDGVVNGLEAPRTATESLAILEWHQVVLYPEGSNTDELEYQAEVRLPTGWKFATALRGAQQPGSESVRFEPVTLTTLVDSTVLTGRYLESFELGGSPPVRLHVAGDGPAAIHFTPETLERTYRSEVIVVKHGEFILMAHHTPLSLRENAKITGTSQIKAP